MILSKIAIIAGCGDVVSLMKEAEAKGAEAYITGEIHCHIDNDYGKQKYSLIMDYVKKRICHSSVYHTLPLNI